MSEPDVQRMLEDWRQSELVRGLGQVECGSNHDRFSIRMGLAPCPKCGAAI